MNVFICLSMIVYQYKISFNHFRQRLLVRAAKETGNSKVLVGDSATRLGVNILSSITQGRGAHLALQVVNVLLIEINNSKILSDDITASLLCKIICIVISAREMGKTLTLGTESVHTQILRHTVGYFDFCLRLCD